MDARALPPASRELRPQVLLLGDAAAAAQIVESAVDWPYTFRTSEEELTAGLIGAVVVLSTGEAASEALARLWTLSVERWILVVTDQQDPVARPTEANALKLAQAWHLSPIKVCTWSDVGSRADALREACAALLPAVPPRPAPLRMLVEAGGEQTARVRILTGRLQIGDAILFSPAHKLGTVVELTALDGQASGEGKAGEVVQVRLREAMQVETGQIVSHESDAPIEANRAKARLCWRSEYPLEVGGQICICVGERSVMGEVILIEHARHVATGQPLEASAPLLTDSVAEVTLQTRGVLVMDNWERVPVLGYFTASRPGCEFVVGEGTFHGGHYVDRTHVKSENIFWSEGNVTAQQRARRNRHKGAVVWLTGLSGSGKSTISRALERELFQLGLHVYVLDGDNVRHGLNANLGFSPEDRVENIRRVAEVAKLLSDAGIIAITAFISPYRDDRRRARQIALEAGGEFIEVFIDAPLEVCEQRDVKGLYKKARAGEIAQFTGISAPYERPVDPEVIVRTDLLSREEAVAAIVAFVRPRLEIEPTPCD